jgi:hypothetical protein
MEIHNLSSPWDDINRRNSKLWSMMNDNSKAAKNRAKFVQQNGGFFTQEGRYWIWTNPVKEQNGNWLKRADTGEKFFFENLTEFGKLHGLTPVKICELLNGKRKTYKGWTAVEVRPVQDRTGSREKIEEPKKQQIKVHKSAIFQNKTTGELVTVSNLKQFAESNNIDYGCIKKLSNGKVKSCKNFQLYDPLAAYKPSSEPK